MNLNSNELIKINEIKTLDIFSRYITLLQMPAHKYSSNEMKELIDVVSTGDDFTPEQISGMNMLAKMLHDLSNMTNSEIEEQTRKYFNVAN
ncbi:MAG: hypothetical protein IPJ79_18715 [Bacteroidetes bacterium]|nr:hypothetical protein [Bacteroidota bacterium]